MIQAISPSNIQNNMSVTPLKPSFKQHNCQGGDCRDSFHRKSSIGDKIAWTAEQFVKGAAVGVIFNGLSDAFNMISKKVPVSSFREYARQAGTCGLFMVAIGLVFEAFDAHNRRKQQ